jgi:phospholipid/cholesterol/gamma-HCH transport system substrate-binding protein
MAGKQAKFLIGIFVTAGLVLAIVAIIWLGASQYFKKGTLFVTYFDESVQGLSVDSNVKYRGVNVGTVRSIQVAPDHNLIEVVMKIDLRGGDENSISAKLKSAGLTGIVYIELDRKGGEDDDLSPHIAFPVSYPLISSRPSDSKYILNVVDKIVSELNHIDMKGIFREMQDIASGLDNFVNDPKIKKIVGHLESATAHLDNTVRQMDRLATDGKLDDIIKETQGTVADVRKLIGKIREDVEQLKLVEAVGRADRVVAGMEKSIAEISDDLRVTTDNIQRASENLDILMDKLRDAPSDLLFSQPPPVPEREKRQ